MKHNDLDPTQVWQRVYPEASGAQQTLQGLLMQLWQDQAFLRQAIGSDPLIQEYTDQASCLKGLLILAGGRVPRNSPPAKSRPTLRQCYDHALQRLGAYQLRSSDPVYGPVFRNLAQQTERHLRLIVQIMGQK